ncbi:MAG: hypothetical protein C5B59_14335 [Bacteroidetes bacterium]|nr:MAG: hypothetical protein C5B59_14335 [Bacteroidota bacterium]
MDGNFKTGRKYNSIRPKFRAPLTQNNMEVHGCYENWTTDVVNEQSFLSLLQCYFHNNKGHDH